MFQESIVSSLPTSATSTTDISIAKIQQAILTSTLGQKPVHIQDEWWTWNSNVMTKRMLLCVIIYAHSGHKNKMTATRVCDNYNLIKHCIPPKFWHSIATNSSASRLICDIALSITIAVNNNESQLSGQVMESIIKEMFAYEHL